MAIRKPLVINTSTGDVEQLQTGDSLQTVEFVQLKNGEAGTVDPGTPVYMQATLSTFKKAQSDVVGTSRCIGLVGDTAILTGATGGVALDGVLTLSIAQWDTACFEAIPTGLTFNTKYYVYPGSAGLISSACPTTTGHYVAELGIALNTTDLKLSIKPIIKL